MKIVSFVAASSNSGKTTLIEKIVRILQERGLRVAVIKHASKGFDLDRPGKDSWRFQEAGAAVVVLVGQGRMAVMKRIDREPTPDELAREAGDCDIIITEGFRHHGVNRVEVFRSGISGDRPLSLTDPSFRALVSDAPFPVPCPRFDINDARAVAEYIIAKF